MLLNEETADGRQLPYATRPSVDRKNRITACGARSALVQDKASSPGDRAMMELRPLRGMAFIVTLVAGVIALDAIRNLHSLMAQQEQSLLGATFARAVPGPAWITESMQSGGPAESAGMSIGDRIDTIDGRRYATPDLAEQELASRHRVTFHVHRGKQTLDIVIDTRKG